MSHTCIAKSLSDLVACQQCGKNQICCTFCFKLKHINQNNSIHPYTKLVDSDVYKNFLKLIHIEWFLGQKLLKSLGSFNLQEQTTKLYILNSAFYGSEFFQQLFKEQKSKDEYLILKNLYSGIEVSFETLSSLVKVLNEVKFLEMITGSINKLTQLTQEQKLMNSHLDFYTGADSYYLEQFIAFEQGIFVQYINKLNDEKKEFNIFKYIEYREKFSQKQRNSIYYSNQFTAFLIQQYKKNSDEKGLYNINDYIANYWEYFPSTINLNNTIKSYFDEEVNFYKVYQKLMTQSNLNITYFGFKVWKLSNGVSKQLPYLKNHYFLYSFAQGYIKMLIDRTYIFLKQEEKDQYAKQNWTDFLRYIKDYSFLVQQNKLRFQFDSYTNYYTFRKRMQLFHDIIKQSKQNIYDKDISVKFFNNQFLNPTIQLKPKHYKDFFQKCQSQLRTKQQNFIKQSETLKEELQNQEKDSFYEFVYLNFVDYCKKQEISLKKTTYYIFKKNVLDNMDEKYIQQTEEKFKRGDFNGLQLDQQEDKEKISQNVQEKKTLVGQTGAKITIGMDQFQQQIFQEQIQEEDGSQGQEVLCSCCHGDPYNCSNQQCEMMGFCTSCSQ